VTRKASAQIDLAPVSHIVARGFLRVHCDVCRLDRVVPYSCECRGFCPSCCGRRMADTAAHLVDRVFPEVPVRQCVLSVPFALRYRLAYDSSLVGDVLQIFVRAGFAPILRRGSISRDTPGCLRPPRHSDRWSLTKKKERTRYRITVVKAEL
jgi:hypothetical protein